MKIREKFPKLPNFDRKQDSWINSRENFEAISEAADIKRNTKQSDIQL